MPGQDEISSTDKLLGVIRGEESDPDEEARPEAPLRAPAAKPPKGLSRKGFSVGVEVGYDRLRLVKIGQKKQLLDWREVPFSASVGRSGPNFPLFLRTALSEFCGSGRNIDLWSAISTAEVELRLLRIPKVPRKQVANAVFWTFKKENPFQEKEVIFDFEVRGEVIEDGVRKIEVMAYTAPKDEAEEVSRAFARAGYNLAGLTAVPFALQNLFRSHWLPESESHTCNLYVGRNWSRIDIFSEGSLVLSRGIRAGLNSMAEALREALSQDRKRIAEPMINFEFDDGEPALEADSPVNSDEDEAREMLFRLLAPSYETALLDGEATLSPDEAFEIVQPAVDRLIRQVERTLEHHAQKAGGERVARLYIDGRITGSTRIMDYISSQLTMAVETLDPLGDGSMAPKGRKTEVFTPALGLALSSGTYTPNLLHTYKSKDAVSRAKTIKRVVLAGFGVLMIVIGGIYITQRHVLNEKNQDVVNLQKELNRFVPNVDKEIITQVLAAKKRKDKKVVQYGKRYRTLAVLSELTNMTPENIRLLDVSVELGAPEPPEEKGKKKKKAEAAQAAVKRVLVIEGFVAGDRATFEPTLAQYLLNLQVSPLFDRPNVTEKTVKTISSGEVLTFTAELVIN